MMKKPIETLIHKEMTRKEFLATMALSMASIMGFSTIIHFLTGKSLSPHGLHSTPTAGYGRSSYGRGPDTQQTAVKSAVSRRVA